MPPRFCSNSRLDASSSVQSCLFSWALLTSSTGEISSQFRSHFSDLASGNLPAVAMIDPGFLSARDEHPVGTDGSPGGSVQVGSKYVSSLINALMTSSSWKDSVFILSFDEYGGFFDHVPPQPTVSPDGILPKDLLPGDPCNNGNGVSTGAAIAISRLRVFAFPWSWYRHSPNSTLCRTPWRITPPLISSSKLGSVCPV